jgi:hypothetical protein
MRRAHWSGIGLLAAASLAVLGLQKAGADDANGATDVALRAAIQSATPFQNNNGIPSPPEYGAFTLSHAWPSEPPPPMESAPWQEAIGDGQITVENAQAYAEAVKQAVATNGTALITQGNGFDAAGAGWFNEPWTGSIREAIQGTYAAGEFGPAIFPGTGLRADFTTHVLTYYDERAAYTLHQVWGVEAMDPQVETERTQFVEGAIIVKAAVFASNDLQMATDWWDAMDGAQQWDVFIPVPSGSPADSAQVWPGYVAQFDIIVKDSQSSPETGWVFMTLVYDSSINSPNIWDKMVILGAQWGNDPQATGESDPLTQNWINPDAPLYATQTFGPNGRLSGPNDGARNNISVCASAGDCGTPMMNAPDSSCMACHSTAQWNVAEHRMPSFLLPSFPVTTAGGPPFLTCNQDGTLNGDGQGPLICSPVPGSADWMNWFQNRLGTQAMNAGSVATDFDEVLSFKSLPLWWAATGPADQPMPMLLLRTGPQRFNQYTGAPLPATP